MGKKIRMIRTMVIEYEPNSDFYEDGTTIEQMAEIDASADDTELLFDRELEKDEIKWEIID